MPIEITQLTDEDIPSAVECIQEAFKDDPYNNWVFHPLSSFSKTRNTHSLTLRCKWGQKHALFHVAKETSPTSPSSSPPKVLGVACWLPPKPLNSPQTWSSYFGDWWLWFEQVKMNLLLHPLTYLTTSRTRYYIWKRAQASAQQTLWTDPSGYYFCNIVTVLPSAQGQGIGKKLFKHVTDQADNEGKRCYLESSRAEPNLKIYEKMGFELKKEMVCDDDGDAITLYCMMREPQKMQESS
ncbi:hypothetical protein CB0940_02405 [Cercospora beticola]|uniref:N-acetyltransferase domain-containing protein n=1 Tax=Cercospora beticola TaxID=122368 RepID=A0A2G5I1X7_CERBT|nr:hypothetical protein CB0940_02405 [Cercospora beticola]PIA98770.1 hypothetical protein CB0940_02405 [Cercospora beticola]